MDIGQDIRHNRKTGFLSNRPAKSDRKTHEQYSRYLGRQQTCLLSDEDRILWLACNSICCSHLQVSGNKSKAENEGKGSLSRSYWFKFALLSWQVKIIRPLLAASMLISRLHPSGLLSNSARKRAASLSQLPESTPVMFSSWKNRSPVLWTRKNTPRTAITASECKYLVTHAIISQPQLAFLRHLWEDVRNVCDDNDPIKRWLPTLSSIILLSSTNTPRPAMFPWLWNPGQ